ARDLVLIKNNLPLARIGRVMGFARIEVILVHVLRLDRIGPRSALILLAACRGLLRRLLSGRRIMLRINRYVVSRLLLGWGIVGLFGRACRHWVRWAHGFSWEARGLVVKQCMCPRAGVVSPFAPTARGGPSSRERDR